MKVSIDRNRELQAVKVTIKIGENFYRISEGFDRCLVINKVGEDGDTITITPKVTNEIEIK